MMPSRGESIQMHTRAIAMRLLSGLVITALCLMSMPARTQAAEHGTASKAAKVSRVHRANSVFRDCPTCPEMVIIPAGVFNMGSARSEKNRDGDEGPVHQVRISSFALGKVEITRGQFAEFVEETKYIADNNCRTLEESRFEVRSGRDWRDLAFLQDDTHPVACINWNEAKAYVKWLSLKTEKQYRLPTEAEWEYAARGNTVTARYWGDSPDKACGYANVADKTAEKMIDGASSWLLHDCGDGFACTAPVGSFKANAFGLYDMLGNVWEWTEDSYHDNYKDAPADGSSWQGNGTMRVLRGGSWNNSPSRVRSAKRGRDKPANRYSNIGFRVARTLP